MVDERRVRRLLQRLADQIAYLEARAAGDRVALRADEERLSGLMYRFVTAIEGVIAVAHHLCASEGWGPPQTNADAMFVLARHDVLDRELAASLAHAVGFRNLLVHQYDDIDDDKVMENLDSLGDLRNFVGSVSEWLAAQDRDAEGNNDSA